MVVGDEIKRHMDLGLGLHGEPRVDGSAPEAEACVSVLIEGCLGALHADLDVVQQPRGREARQVDAEREARRHPHRLPDKHEPAYGACLKVAVILFQLAVETRPLGAKNVDINV